MIAPFETKGSASLALRRLSRFVRVIGVAAPLLAAPAVAQHLRLVPRLRPGQVLFYQLEFNASRTTKVDSPIATPALPPGANISASCLLQVQVVAVDTAGIRLKTYLSEKTTASPDSSGPAPDQLIEVKVAWNGAASEIQGLDQLSAALRFAWNGWLARFTSSLTYPKSGVHSGEKWQRSDPETTPSPLAKLVWLKKYQYVRDEPCGSSPAAGADTCAVILIRAQLHQKSDPDQATPEDFKLRGLVTHGIASGNNETILYISRTTGWLVRSTEVASQLMDATIALADGSNQVRYLMEAKSRSLVRLLPDSPQDVR